MDPYQNTPYIIATGGAPWGVDDNYTSFAQGTTSSYHYIPVDTVDLQLAYSGFTKPGTFTTPTEGEIGPYEVIVSVERVQSDFTTGIGLRRKVTWNNRRWYLVGPGTCTLSDPVGGFYPAGTWIRVRTFCSRCVSTGTTIGTEVGQIPVLGALWPRTGGIGGTAPTATLAGLQASASTTLDAATWNKADSGTITVSNTGGVVPSVIVGKFCDPSGLARSTAAPVALIGDSLTNGSGDLQTTTVNWTGRGYALHAFVPARPTYHASTGGNGVQYYIGDYLYNWAQRSVWISKCLVAHVALGTNDLVAGRTAAQVKADLVALWALLRKIGILKIVGVPITPRTNGTAGSTDGYQTDVNQVQTVGFWALAADVNSWLPTQVGIAGGIDELLDINTVAASGTVPGNWALSTVNRTVTVAPGSTTTVINVVETLTATTLNIKGLLSGTDTRLISSNTASTITLNSALPGVPADGATLTVLNGVPTYDGVHYGPEMHNAIGDYLTANISKYNV